MLQSVYLLTLNHFLSGSSWYINPHQLAGKYRRYLTVSFYNILHECLGPRNHIRVEQDIEGKSNLQAKNLTDVIKSDTIIYVLSNLNQGLIC